MIFFFFSTGESQVSSYDDYMKRWLQYYPLEKFLLLENKRLKKMPLKVLSTIEAFLGIKNHYTHGYLKQEGIKRHYNYMSDQTRRIPINYFRPHNIRFFRLVGRKFDWKLYP